MKLIVVYITNNSTPYGRVHTLRQAVLFVFMGNPTKYKGNTFNWEQGRKLASGTMNGNNFAYNYDGNGMRYEKKVNGVRTCYYYNGSQLLMESKNGSRTWYIYGITGIEGMIVESGWQDSIYYFDKNTLGDVVAIRDESGDVVATYEYDAWGNCTVYDEWGDRNTNTTFIGNINPIRYRGYYYDNETGFYYLQTRYYDPTIMRFINADNYELVSQLAGSKELNMYAYCNNNPVMYTDETGEIAWGLIIGAVIGGVFGGISAYMEGEDVAIGVLVGGMSGLVMSATPNKSVLKAFVAFSVSTAGTLINDWANYRTVDIEKALTNGGISAALSFIKIGKLDITGNETIKNATDDILSNTVGLWTNNIGDFFTIKLPKMLN